MKLKPLGELKNIPVYALSMETNDPLSKCCEFDLFDKFPELFSKSFLKLKYRAVSLSNWKNVQKYGVDVLPTDSVIYCDYLEKAMEYGEWPKVVMGFDAKKMDKTFREVDSNIEPDELSELLKIYPTQEKSMDGSRIWLSRLSCDDRRRNTGYEISYAQWIPNSPWDALKLIIFADLAEREWVFN